MSDIEIARKANKKNIKEIAIKLNLEENDLRPYGHYIAKIDNNSTQRLPKKESKLILVTAISPTPAGEGKTTTSVGLSDGLCKIGKQSIVCLREPSLGPSFGMKGGAAGGGYAQVHAITSANNLLASLIDNHIYWGNKLGIDVRRVSWKRCLDLNDRALREITVNLGGVANGYPRQDGFNITVASEVMAIFCLANDLKDLERRLGNITVAYTREKKAIFAKDLKAEGPMTVLLKQALMPNLVQTLENNPAIIHGGPFANIAHGCNSVIATKTSLQLSDYVVTEAGFGADLGAEKFFDIKCRKSGLTPSAVVLVATIRALKMHGGVAKANLSNENVEAVKSGISNLKRHVSNIKKFGLPVVIAINHFVADTENEMQALQEECKSIGVETVPCYHWAKGGEGTVELAKKVVEIANGINTFKYLYEDKISLLEKIKTIATEIYDADDVIADSKIRDQLKQFEENGYGDFPICIAKTQYSFSTDPTLKGAPSNHSIPIREVRLSSGAEFIVVVCGEIMTMPGLPSVPAANSIFLNDEGEIEGLF